MDKVRTRGRSARWLAEAWVGLALWFYAPVLGVDHAGGPTPGQVEEYKLKAVFLYKFTGFIDWPPAAFDTTNAPFVLGVLGRDPFGPHLQEVTATKLVRGRRLVLQHFEHADQVRAARCHLLFIPKSERENLARLLSWLKSATAPKPPMLTVGEEAESRKEGLIMNLLVEEKTRRLQFQIDRGAAAAAGLQISSELLDLARTVYGAPKGTSR